MDNTWEAVWTWVALGSILYHHGENIIPDNSAIIPQVSGARNARNDVSRSFGITLEKSFWNFIFGVNDISLSKLGCQSGAKSPKSSTAKGKGRHFLLAKSLFLQSEM